MQDQIRMKKTPRGERCGSNKYKESTIKEVKEKLRKGGKVVPLSKEYGINKQTLYSIKNGHIWNWL